MFRIHKIVEKHEQFNRTLTGTTFFKSNTTMYLFKICIKLQTQKYNIFKNLCAMKNALQIN